MFTKIIALALMFASVACSADLTAQETCHDDEIQQEAGENICHGEFSVYVPDFTPEQLVSFIKAESEFNSFFGKNLLHFSFTNVKQEACQGEDCKPACQAQTKDLTPENFDGMYMFDDGMIYLDMATLRYSEKSFVGVIEHESFHSFGAIHRCNSLMAASGFHVLSEVDRQQAKALGMIP